MEKRKPILIYCNFCKKKTIHVFRGEQEDYRKGKTKPILLYNCTECKTTKPIEQN